jgi:hypothetical protein
VEFRSSEQLGLDDFCATPGSAARIMRARHSVFFISLFLWIVIL